ncbi:WhiB family transcriptional regulator [Rhodococcus pyridinivorans]|uniref:WhiB family transcriptional regulator n=1 Tax=Rhodococcus pyridinivorans TaxID=103816 RepID=UPI0026586990|nr:WhiB family transcriptional regulator [Rhodococcus pyridinivorans]
MTDFSGSLRGTADRHVAVLPQDSPGGNEWVQFGLCAQADPDLFYPRAEHKTEPSRAAKRICRSCSVQPDCLDYALSAGEPHGIWGGATTVERSAILARRVSKRGSAA